MSLLNFERYKNIPDKKSDIYFSFKVTLFGIIVYWKDSATQVVKRKYIKILSKSVDHRSVAVVQYLDFVWSTGWFKSLVSFCLKYCKNKKKTNKK